MQQHWHCHIVTICPFYVVADMADSHNVAKLYMLQLKLQKIVTTCSQNLRPWNFAARKYVHWKKILWRINFVFIKFSLNALLFEKSRNECKNPSFLHKTICTVSDHGTTKMQCCISAFIAWNYRGVWFTAFVLWPLPHNGKSVIRHWVVGQ